AAAVGEEFRPGERILPLALRRLPEVHDHVSPGRPQGGVDGMQDRCIERAADERYEHADGLRLSLLQHACRVRGTVFQFFYCLADAPDRAFGYGPAARNDTGRGA